MITRRQGTRYAQYRRDPDLQEIHRRHPFIAVWDDHESADNSWRDGAVNHQPESEWDGYVAARRRLFDTLRASGLGDVVVLTGDTHTSWASELTDDPNDPASYDPGTGAGAVGVEFVTASITSPGIDGVGNALIPVFQSANPHIKWADLERRGYVVLDVTAERAQASWFHFDRVDLPDDAVETFARAFSVRAGETRLREHPSPAQAAGDSGVRARA